MPESREPLTADEVVDVANLAMLDLTAHEIETFAAQLDAVLDMASQLEAFDMADVEPTAHPFGLVNVFRVDEPEPQAVTEALRTEALAAAPEVEEHQFKVPPALGEAP